MLQTVEPLACALGMRWPVASPLSAPGYKGAWAFCRRECNVESDLCDGGKAPFLEQLKTGQNSPDR